MDLSKWCICTHTFRLCSLFLPCVKLPVENLVAPAREALSEPFL